PTHTDAYVVSAQPQAALLLAEQLRSENPDFRLISHCGGGSFKSQLRKADRSEAKVALILGEEEIAQGQVTIKPLRIQAEQITVPQDEAFQHIARLIID